MNQRTKKSRNTYATPSNILEMLTAATKISSNHLGSGRGDESLEEKVKNHDDDQKGGNGTGSHRQNESKRELKAFEIAKMREMG